MAVEEGQVVEAVDGEFVVGGKRVGRIRQALEGAGHGLELAHVGLRVEVADLTPGHAAHVHGLALRHLHLERLAEARAQVAGAGHVDGETHLVAGRLVAGDLQRLEAVVADHRLEAAVALVAEEDLVVGDDAVAVLVDAAELVGDVGREIEAKRGQAALDRGAAERLVGQLLGREHHGERAGDLELGGHVGVEVVGLAGGHDDEVVGRRGGGRGGLGRGRGLGAAGDREERGGEGKVAHRVASGEKMVGLAPA